jgi:hypothetical protein
MNNLIHKTVKSATPVVGTPATFLSFSDRNPGVVTKINSPKNIEIAYVETETLPNPNTKDGSYEMGEIRQYKYIVDLTRQGAVYTLRKDGNWQQKGCALKGGCGKVVLGYMERYYDPSF